jgi:hypothetical protein
LNIVSALASQLEEAFECLDVGPLSEANINTIPADAQGVYLLQLKKKVVYAGKADDGLRKRLHDHRTKIGGRRNIHIDDMGFKALYVAKNWTALAPETMMIAHYRALGLAECNGTGFGIHDPGRERETTAKPPAGFDAKYPIRDDWPCDWIDAGDWTAANLLAALKKGLPYLLRYETERTRGSKVKASDYAAKVAVPSPGMPARELLKLIARALAGFQATVFPSHMILYREKRDYSAAEGKIIWPVK